ncbi:MAG: Uncharacterised protein [Flavobacterium sp. SCGC AAA160-P02]|nr:MAG: Uncharacterised protein [Flavobacterium sp. SCGC AAA160-P02]
MTTLEEKILDLLPILSDEAKNRARFILGTKPTKKRKRKQALTIEEARIIVRKTIDKWNIKKNETIKGRSLLQQHP